jgi:hypothetical protein
MAYLNRNQDVDDIDMNRLVSTLKYELLCYTSNMVHKKFNRDQLYKKLVVMNEFMDTMKSMKDNLKNHEW